MKAHLRPIDAANFSIWLRMSEFRGAWDLSNETTGGFPMSFGRKFEPLLPTDKEHPLGCHNPRVSARNAMNAILFVLRTRCQWNALNDTGICSSSSAHRRFLEWTEAGVFEKAWVKALGDCEEFVGIDWTWLSMDGGITKAPLGGEKDRAEPRAFVPAV